MIIVDTSIWVDHFREPIKELERLAAAVLLVQHPFVTGELALGTLRERATTLVYLSKDLPRARVASEGEFLTFVTRESLAETGIGFVDSHLLASCRLMPGTSLWTRDKRLARWARECGVRWEQA
ncbi:MAG TPA: PIN domain-containing protein [Allosphingosinicella sp.]|nr:PIN domain-containing protein [Allosphingosinicella sp.]